MGTATGGGTSVVLQRKRLSSCAKKPAKTATGALGAVRLSEVPQDAAEAAVAAKDRVQVEEAVAAKPQPQPVVATPLSPTRRFQKDLKETGTTDKWFDEQMSAPKAMDGRRRSSSGAQYLTDAERANVKAKLARQFRSIQDTFKQHFDAVDAAPGATLSLPASAENFEGFDLSGGGGGTAAEVPNSIMDLGLDAIHKVGRTCLEIANAVDTTIEQWLEGFQSLEELQRYIDHTTQEEPSSSAHSPPAQCNASDGGWSLGRAAPRQGSSGAAASPTSSTHITRKAGASLSPGSPERRNGRLQRSSTATARQRDLRRGEDRAVSRMEEEIQRREAEFKRMQEECSRLQAELSYAANKCSALTQENTLLRSNNPGSPSAPEAPGAVDTQALTPEPAEPEADPITEFMAQQLAAVAKEKAELAQENARLMRENCTLQDMLSISMSCDEEGIDECDTAISSLTLAPAQVAV